MEGCFQAPRPRCCSPPTPARPPTLPRPPSTSTPPSPSSPLAHPQTCRSPAAAPAGEIKVRICECSNSSLPLASTCPWTGSCCIGVVGTAVHPQPPDGSIGRSGKPGRGALRGQDGWLQLLHSSVASLPPEQVELESESERRQERRKCHLLGQLLCSDPLLGHLQPPPLLGDAQASPCIWAPQCDSSRPTDCSHPEENIRNSI